MYVTIFDVDHILFSESLPVNPLLITAFTTKYFRPFYEHNVLVCFQLFLKSDYW